MALSRWVLWSCHLWVCKDTIPVHHKLGAALHSNIAMRAAALQPCSSCAVEQHPLHKHAAERWRHKLGWLTIRDLSVKELRQRTELILEKLLPVLLRIEGHEACCVRLPAGVSEHKDGSRQFSSSFRNVDIYSGKAQHATCAHPGLACKHLRPGVPRCQDGPLPAAGEQLVKGRSALPVL